MADKTGNNDDKENANEEEKEVPSSDVDIQFVDSDNASDSDSDPQQPVIRSRDRPSQGDIHLSQRGRASSPPGNGLLYNTQSGETVCADGSHPDVICSDRDPRILTEDDEMGFQLGEDSNTLATIAEDEPFLLSKSTADKQDLNALFPSIKVVLTAVEWITYTQSVIHAKLPSRTRHSSRRRRLDRADADGAQPGPSGEADIEMHPMPHTPIRKRSSRRSVKNALRAHSAKSIKRGPGESLNIMERRTLRREELNQMHRFEIKNLPFCTWIGYQLSIAIQKTWQKLAGGVKNFRIWGGPIREIEGNLGSGVSTYFRVVRWLLMINFLNLIVALAFITAPSIYMLYGPMDGKAEETSYNADDVNCTSPNFLDPTENTPYYEYANNILQFLTGTGWMEKTPLYIGWYMSRNISSSNIKYRTSGCLLDDEYRCYTFKNPVISGSTTNERKYDNTKINMEFDPTKNGNYTGDKYNCEMNCPSDPSDASVTAACSMSCYKCGESCKDKEDSSATVEFNDSDKQYKCFDLIVDATYGAKDCQFPLVDETGSLGLKCDACRRFGVIYNYALAYVLVGLSYFAMSLIFVIKNMMKLFKKSAVELVGYTPYSQLVFGGWDYNIENKESAILKSKSIMKSLKEELTSDDQKDKLVTTKERVLLVLLRLFTNVLCLGAMGGVVYLYWKVYQEKEDSNPCDTEEDNIDIDGFDIEQLASLWASYAPAIIVSASNVVFPIFFEFIGNIEMYQFQSTRINVTMFRSFVMKLFSIIAYLYILYETVEKTQETQVLSDAQIATSSDTAVTGFTYNCWENFIGMELYRLIVIDFGVFCMALFTTEWCRRFMVNHNRFLRDKFNISEFNISKEVLDICYKQMIFWSAIFFCPLVSVVAFIEIILIFYFKKISALRNVRPPEKVILNSSSSSIINAVFTLSLLVVFVPIGFIIFTFGPSKKCGPFRMHSSFIDPFNSLIDKSGIFKDYVIDNLKVTSFVVVLVVVIMILIYYFYSLAQARELTIGLLREQIKVENADKKFLIEQMRGDRNGAQGSGSVEIADNVGKTKKKKAGTYANPNIKLRK